MTATIDFRTVTREVPVFSTNVLHCSEALDLARQAILEERLRDPVPMESNVHAKYVSGYSSHLLNPKFQPLVELVLSFTEEVSRTYFKCDLKYKCYNLWGMMYEDSDFAVKHNHFPSTFGAVVYIDVERDSSPIVFEDQLTVVPAPGSLVLFPAYLDHEVPKTRGKRTAVAMNIDHMS